MSNRAFIEVDDGADEMWTVKVYDEYDSGEIVLFQKPPDSDVDLLKSVRQHAENEFRTSPQAERAKGVLENVEEMSKGITIRDTYYDWPEIAPAYEDT